MIRMGILLLTTAFLASACAQSSTRSATDWGNISGTQVAKVSNIKSLISPGFQ